MGFLQTFYRHLLIIPIALNSGSMFNFYTIVDHQADYEEQEEACRNLGYDGLAALSSPEAHAYAMKIAKTYLIEEEFYVGIHPANNIEATLWDDGSPLASDFTVTFGTDPRIGRLDATGRVKLAAGTADRFALCGYHTRVSSEAHGSTVSDTTLNNMISVLYEAKLNSYLECAILCASYSECKAVQYEVQTHLCSIVSEGGYTGCWSSDSHETNVFKNKVW